MGGYIDPDQRAYTRRLVVAPFSVDEAKLRRVVTVFRERFGKATELVERYRVQFSTGQVLQTDSLENVLRLDNADREQVTQLAIDIVSVTKNGDELVEDESGGVRIDLDGALFAYERASTIEVVANGHTLRWVHEAFAVANGQAERLRQKGLAPFFVSARSATGGLFPFVVLLAAIVLGAVVALPRPTEAPLAQTSWLSQADIAELEKSPGPAQPALALQRQLSNIRQHYDAQAVKRTGFQNWRVWLITLPLLAIVACLSFLAVYCYPAAVFAWGDGAERWRAAQARRRIAWSLLVGFVVVEVASNLFGVGLNAALGR